MITAGKINERLDFSLADSWVPMANHRQVSAVGLAPITSPSTQVTVQLRKATSAAGADAADLGTAVIADDQAVAQAYASELGETAGGVPFTHVSAVITSSASPDPSFGTVVRGSSRFNP